jgi:hypothetical protein
MRLKGPYHNRLAAFVGPTHLIFVTLNPLAFQSFRLIFQSRAVEVCGVPHLAKNERDVGHPESAAWTEWKIKDPASV